MALLRSRVRAGGMADKMFPGYKEKIWALVPNKLQSQMILRDNGKFEASISEHMSVQRFYKQWKDIENKLRPSSKYRKPAVDWRRQIERGTMHYGRWYEGPNGSDYRPGRTFDRLENTAAPFTDAEWEERKNHRSWDLVHFAYGLVALIVVYRLTNEWPVVWCDDRVPTENEKEKKEEE